MTAELTPPERPQITLALPTWAADLLDRLLLEGAHGPVAATAGDPTHEVAQERGAVRRVHDFEVELGGIEPACFIGDDGDRRVARGAEHAEAVGQFRHPVAMAHPYRIALAFAPCAREQRGVLGDQYLGASELAMMSCLHRAAELCRHRLLAVADAEDRHACVIDHRRGERRIPVEHGGWAARKDHAFRPHRLEGFFRFLEWHDLAIDLVLAHAPRNQLGDLRAEINDQNLVVRILPVCTGFA